MRAASAPPCGRRPAAAVVSCAGGTSGTIRRAACRVPAVPHHNQAYSYGRNGINIDIHLHTAAPTPRFRHHHHPRAPRRPRPARPMHAGACIIHAEQHLHLCEPASADTLGPPGHTLSQAQVHTWAFLHTDFSLAGVCEWGSIMTREAVKATTFHKQAGARGWRPESRSALVAFVPLALSRVQGDPVALGTDRCRALHVALIPIRLRSSLVN